MADARDLPFKGVHGMNVAQLIALLQTMPADRPVMIKGEGPIIGVIAAEIDDVKSGAPIPNELLEFVWVLGADRNS